MRWASMKAAFPLLLALACAPAGPGEYHRGTYRPVRPPAFSPAEDAPHTTGQAGHMRQPLPRSPHKRVLPPSREPGLWSGDSPRASLSPPATFMDVVLPIAQEDAALPAVKKCAMDLAVAVVADASMVKMAMRHTREERACASFSVFTECLREAVRESPGDGRLRAAWERADAAMDAMCKGRFGDVKDLAYSIERAMRAPPPPPGGMLQ